MVLVVLPALYMWLGTRLGLGLRLGLGICGIGRAAYLVYVARVRIRDGRIVYVVRVRVRDMQCRWWWLWCWYVWGGYPPRNF